jgi:site-specific recombinase XerD
MGRISTGNDMVQFSCKIDANPALWDVRVYTKTVEKCGYVTAEQVKNELTGVTGKSDTLLKLFREHNEEYEKRVGIDRKHISYYNYVNTYNNLSSFIRSKYGQEDYPIKQLNITFINDFDFYLRVDAKFKTNSIQFHVINLKKIITRAINQGIISKNPFGDYVAPRTELKYFHISSEELTRIISTPVPEKPEKLQYVRDMFVFSCFTGLAYAEIRQLSGKHLRKTPDGKVWIDISRQKTGVECNIKLLQLPLSIIEKYRCERKGDLLFNLPTATTICYNLRKLEKLCDIKHLHFHMARHTFATVICLNNGVPLETISKMMGHSSIHTTQIYAEITSQKVGADMKKLAERTKGKHVIN